MNIALPAIILFVLLLPGLIVRSRFKRVERLSLDYSPFGQVVTEAVLWTCVLHLIWLTVAYLVLDQRLQTDVLLNLLSASPTGQSMAISLVSSVDEWIMTYFVTLLFVAYAAPTLARWAIIHWRLDRSNAPLSSLFRFRQAPWYYLLTGADFAQDEQPDLISVAAIVNTAGIATLYTGILEDFFIDQDGTLDRLILSNVSRRQMSSDRAMSDDGTLYGEERFYPVEGDYFVLRYSEAITLNIQYILLEEEAQSSNLPD